MQMRTSCFTPLDRIGLRDLPEIGYPIVGLAMVRRLGLPRILVPEGYAIGSSTLHACIGGDYLRGRLHELHDAASRAELTCDESTSWTYREVEDAGVDAVFQREACGIQQDLCPDFHQGLSALNLTWVLEPENPESAVEWEQLRLPRATATLGMELMAGILHGFAKICALRADRSCQLDEIWDPSLFSPSLLVQRVPALNWDAHGVVCHDRCLAIDPARVSRNATHPGGTMETMVPWDAAGSSDLIEAARALERSFDRPVEVQWAHDGNPAGGLFVTCARCLAERS